MNSLFVNLNITSMKFNYIILVFALVGILSNSLYSQTERNLKCGAQDFSFEPTKYKKRRMTAKIQTYFIAYDDSTNKEVYCPAGKYKVVAYKYYGTNYHDIGNCQLYYGMGSPGSPLYGGCNLLNKPVFDVHFIVTKRRNKVKFRNKIMRTLDVIFEDVKFVKPPDNYSATLSGYLYKITKVKNSKYEYPYEIGDVWIPFNPKFVSPRISYRLHTAPLGYRSQKPPCK